MSYIYNNYVKNLHDRFVRRLEDINGVYNFDFGGEFEIALCEVLREFLPSQYGVCRGYVVTKSGEIAGDDIIIYDQVSFPRLTFGRENSFARKENIPVEAVYAYIEAKHNLVLSPELNECVLNKALSQVKKVKQLINTRRKRKGDLGSINVEVPYNEQYLPLIKRPDYLPQYANPFITAIVSRYISWKKSSVLLDSNDANDAVADKVKNLTGAELPEIIVAGNCNFYYPYSSNHNHAVPFILDQGCRLAVVNDEISFGAFLAQLFFALDQITLAPMPWDEILNDLKKLSPPSR